MKLGLTEIGENKPVSLICEGGVTNYGQLDLGKLQIEAALEAGADFIKFQAWKTEELVSRKTSDRLKKELKFNWFERLREKEYSFDDLETLFEYARQKGLQVFATPHDLIALEFLDKKLNQEVFKIGSGEAHNYEFLKAVGNCKKPVLISFGFQTDEEILHAVDVLSNAGAPEIIALHCVSLYPTPYEHAQLRRIEHLRKLLGIPIGLSDHSIGWHIPLASIPFGVCVIEKHLTFDKTDPRSLDNPGALLPDEFKLFVGQVRHIEKGLRHVSENERLGALEKARQSLGQSLVAAQDIQAGTTITAGMVAFKRPGLNGLPPSAISQIIGRKVTHLIEKDEQIILEKLT